MQEYFIHQLNDVMIEFESGQFEKGMAQLKAMLSFTSNSEEKLEIARVYIQLGLIEEAEEIIDTLSNEENKVASYRLKAEISYKQGDYDKALELMHAVIEHRKDDNDYTFLSQIYFDEGLPEVAYRYINKSIEKNSGVPYYYYQKGLYAYEMGEIEDAVANFQIASDLEEGEPLYHLALGEAYYSVGQFEEALDKYDDVLDKHPEQEEALYLKGILLVQMNAIEEGITYLEKVLELQPENQNILFSLADAYDRNHDQTNSIKSLEKILHIDSLHFPALKRLLEILVYQEDWSKAKKILDKARQIDPDDETIQILFDKLNKVNSFS